MQPKTKLGTNPTRSKEGKIRTKHIRKNQNQKKNRFEACKRKTTDPKHFRKNKIK